MENLINQDEKNLYEKILNIENLKAKDENFKFCGGNAIVGAYADLSCIPDGTPIEKFFRKKVVVYLGFTKDNESNIGYSTDFLERIHTYTKDARAPKSAFTKSAKRYGEMNFRILLIRDFDDFNGDVKAAKKWGRKMETIAHYKQEAINAKTCNILK